MGIQPFLGITDFYHSYFTTASLIATKIGTTLLYDQSMKFKTGIPSLATVVPNRSLFGIPISTSLTGQTVKVFRH